MSHWRQRAVCAQIDPELWYPDIGGYSVFSPAPRICRTCGVRAECLADSLIGGVAEGTWGGISAGNRRRIQIAFNREQPDDAKVFAERAIIEFEVARRAKKCAA
jgi:WhiB family redox-sensing transcriptional regulator